MLLNVNINVLRLLLAVTVETTYGSNADISRLCASEFNLQQEMPFTNCSLQSHDDLQPEMPLAHCFPKSHDDSQPEMMIQMLSKYMYFHNQSNNRDDKQHCLNVTGN